MARVFSHNHLARILAGRIRQPFDFIQIKVIQALYQRLYNRFHLPIIDQVSLGRINFSFHPNIKSKRMTVQPMALVIRRKRRQIVCGLEMK